MNLASAMEDQSQQTILFLASNPLNPGRLRLDQECREVESVLRQSQQRDAFRLEPRWAVRSQDMRRALLDLSPTIVHFAGHGKGVAMPEAATDVGDTRQLNAFGVRPKLPEGLVFEGEGSQPVVIGGKALADLLALFRDSVQCVVMNACYSANQAQAIGQHIPYVIGMRQEVGDKVAIRFAVEFYRAIGAGRPIKFAYEFAKNALQELPEMTKAHLPVLLHKPDLDTPVASDVESASPDPQSRKSTTESTQTDTPGQWLLAHPYGMPPYFTGRNTEREMLSNWLNNDQQHPLFVLRALGGFGKSAVTWHWLTHDVSKHHWPRVVWWSFYEAKAGFDNFVYATLTYLSGQKPEDINRSERIALLLNYLQQYRILLVLDGFERELRAYSSMGVAYQSDQEQVIADNDRDCVNPDAEQFLRSLCSLPNLRAKVLMSTRLRPCPLEVTGGMLLAGCRETELRQMQPDDAVQFFRVQGIRGNRGEIEQACEAYGFHPLSLRLLAGLVMNDWRNPKDIQAAQRLDVTGDLMQRQHHVLEQSYQNLNSSGRQLLSRLACFRSPVEGEVLEAVMQPKSEPELQDKASWLGRLLGQQPKPKPVTQKIDTQKELRNLIGRGLVQREQSRFDLHPIVRRYAYDRMGNEDRNQTHSQLRDYFAAVPKAERVTSIDDLAPVIELYHHMVRAGQYDEAREMFRDRLSTPLYFQLGAYQKQTELLRALFPQGEQQLPQLQNESAQAWTLNALASSYSLNGQPAQAVPLFEQHNTIRENQGDKNNWAIGLGNLAYQQLPTGALQAAEANLRRAIALCQEIEDKFWESVGQQELGRLLAYRGAWAASEEELDRALELFEKSNSIQSQGIVWVYRALRSLLWIRDADTIAPQRTELTTTALAAAQKALELTDEYARTSYPVEREYIRAHWLLGAVHRLIPNLTDSDHHLTEALRRCRAINSVDAEADILLDLARLRRDQGNPTEAHRLAEEARHIASRSGYVLQGADIHLLLAELAREDGDLAQARQLAQEALQLATCDGGEYVYRVAYDEAEALMRELE